MKKIILSLLAGAVAFSFSACHKSTSNVALHNQQDTLNWVIGQGYATSVLRSGVDVDKDMIMKAFEATLYGNERIPDTSRAYREALDYFNSELALAMKKHEEKRMGEVGSFENEYFAKLMKDNPNVKKADAGFYYEVKQKGSGRKSEHGLVVTFDYKGYLPNGQLFDQTYGNRQPIRHVVGSPMFQGMQDAFEMMREGDIWRCYFPSELAFGAEGSTDIPPYSTVIYEIELKKVED